MLLLPIQSPSLCLKITQFRDERTSIVNLSERYGPAAVIDERVPQSSFNGSSNQKSSNKNEQGLDFP